MSETVEQHGVCFGNPRGSDHWPDGNGRCIHCEREVGFESHSGGEPPEQAQGEDCPDCKGMREIACGDRNGRTLFVPCSRCTPHLTYSVSPEQPGGERELTDEEALAEMSVFELAEHPYVKEYISRLPEWLAPRSASKPAGDGWNEAIEAAAAVCEAIEDASANGKKQDLTETEMAHQECADLCATSIRALKRPTPPGESPVGERDHKKGGR